MKRLLTGMVVGAMAITAINKNRGNGTFKKSKRAIKKKVDDMLNI